MSTVEIPTLWESATVVTTRKPTREEAFAQFLRRNPGFMRRLAALCYEQQSRGQRPSTKAAWEVLRYEVAPNGEPWALNNSWTSIAADRLCELHPDLNIERRKRKS